MPIFVCRNRVLSVRVSEEEYDVLVERSAREGARSLSDFVRAAVLAPVPEIGHDSQNLEAKVAGLEELDRKVGRLSRKLD